MRTLILALVLGWSGLAFAGTYVTIGVCVDPSDSTVQLSILGGFESSGTGKEEGLFVSSVPHPERPEMPLTVAENIPIEYGDKGFTVDFAEEKVEFREGEKTAWKIGERTFTCEAL